MKRKMKRLYISIEQEKLPQLAVDAIVNDTDPLLSLPEAWLQQAGRKVETEVSLVGWCDVGSATITTAGNLPSRWIIHAVGPRWGDASARGKLAKVTWEILQLAEEREITSLALPPLATGAHGYPVESCARVMLEQIIDFAYEPLNSLRSVRICTENAEQQSIFVRELQRQLDEADDSGQNAAQFR